MFRTAAEHSQAINFSFIRAGSVLQAIISPENGVGRPTENSTYRPHTITVTITIHHTLPERGGKVDSLWKSSGVPANVAMKTFRSELVRVHTETLYAGR